jgi:hypothetical protein
MNPTFRHRDPEFYQRVAASLISRRLVARQATRRASSKKCEAMAALLDRVATRMRKLPLKERLEFFRSSVAIVAEILAAMQRDTSPPARLTLAKAA